MLTLKKATQQTMWDLITCTLIKKKSTQDISSLYTDCVKNINILQQARLNWFVQNAIGNVGTISF